MVPQITAAAAVTRGARNRWPGVGIGMGALVWSLILTVPEWPTGRRAALMGSQACYYGCFGILLSGWADGKRNGWLLAFYGAMSAWQIAQQWALTQERVQEWSTYFVWGITLLMLAWIRGMNYGRIKAK